MSSRLGLTSMLALQGKLATAVRYGPSQQMGRYTAFVTGRSYEYFEQKKLVPKIVGKSVYLLLASGKLDTEKIFQSKFFTPREEDFHMPKQKQEDVNKLLTNMKGSAAKAKGPQKVSQETNSLKADSLHRYLDISSYKDNNSWPGSGYLLVGNSYNLQRAEGKQTSKKTKRAASINEVLQLAKGNRNWVNVQNALCHAGFVESLSRFEYDWLRREPANTVIGAAYDEKGKVITGSFAVWRIDTVAVPTAGGQKQKELVGAK